MKKSLIIYSNCQGYIGIKHFIHPILENEYSISIIEIHIYISEKRLFHMTLLNRAMYSYISL